MSAGCTSGHRYKPTGDGKMQCTDCERKVIFNSLTQKWVEVK